MAAKEEVNNPRQVIERIRTEDYLLDIEQESDKIRRGAKSLHKKLNSALELLSKDLYSKKSHFVLELVQNADDNDYPKGTVPKLTFKLEPERLVLLNNEVGFSERNVQALCSVGDSSKAKKSGYIGEKGIGFKSVFTVSNAPEIHSNGFHFRFDRTDEANLLGYVVPEWCEPDEEARADSTTVVLPAAPGYKFGPETIEDLDARLLLFLSKLREIELEQGGARTSFRRRDKKGLSHLITEVTRTGTEPSTEEARFVRISVDFSMEKVPDEKRPDVATSTVVLAFPVDKTGAADPQQTSQVFAFLPIRPVGFKFSIQADFILSSSREDILTDRAWNQLLRSGIADAFKMALPTFKASDALAFSYLKYLPSDGEISDPFFRSVADSIVTQLAQTECLPSEGGTWRLPSELRIAEKRFRELFPSALALELFGFDYVDHRVQGGNDLLRRLGVKSLAFTDIFGFFKAKGDWLKAQDTEWKGRFYAYLADLDLQKLIAGLSALPCIPTSSGALVVPKEAHVFQPLGRGKKYGFENELVIIDSDLTDAAQSHSEKIHALFAALQVKSDNPYHLVTSHILSRYHGESWKLSENKALIGHLRYIKDKFKEYMEGAVAAGKTESQALQALRDGLWIGTKLNTDQWLFAKPYQLYLSQEYRPAFSIEWLLGEEIDKSLLVSPDYLASKAKDPEAEAESWRAFFVRLGVCVAPRLDTVTNGDRKCSPELQLLLSSPRANVRRATLECLDSNWSQYFSHLSFALLSGRAITPKETQFSVSLRSMLAPTKKRVSPPISEVFYATPELKALFGDRLVYIDAILGTQILDACGVTHRLDAKACLKRLRQLKTEGGDTTPQLQALYRHLEQFWDKDGAVIKQAFALEGLIRIKGTRPVWARPTEVAWRSNGPFLDSLYPPLQSQYRDFSAFFNEKLGIPKELPTGKWVEALSRLEQIESVDERRREALAIYKRANRDLSPRFGRDEVPTPDWIGTFETDEVYLNQRDELISNSKKLFANDDPEMAALFVDEAEISFLAVSPEEVPRLDRLLSAAEVPRLSTSVAVELMEASDGRVESALTSKIRRAVPYLGRVLYSKSHERFENAIQRGMFRTLRHLEVVEVSELRLAITLASITRTTIADLAHSEGKILIRATARSIRDQLAMEVCKLLEAPVEIADTFARVLVEEDSEDIEDFLRVRRIGQLPADLIEALVGDDAQQTFEEESIENGEQDQSPPNNEESVDEFLAEEEELPAAEPLPTQNADRNHRTPVRVELASADEAASVDAAGETGPGRSPAPAGSRSPEVSPRTMNSGSESSELRPSSPSVSDAPSHRIGSQVANSGGEQASGSTELPETGGDLQLLAHTTPNGGAQRSERSASTGLPRSPRIKWGRGGRYRTKAGRLMSYADAPGDSNEAASKDQVNDTDRVALGKEAVAYFIATQAGRWKSLVPMAHENPGFDVKAVAHDGVEERIEVKGQSGAWTETGVALTPTELEFAQKYRDRYWLCVVEHMQDEKRRFLYLVKDPYGQTQQFRFDSGWKTAAIGQATVPLKPAVGLYIEMPGVGRGRILSVKKGTQLFKVHVLLDGGGQVNRLFNPTTMKLSAE